MLDMWAALVASQHRPPRGAIAAADSDAFFDFLPAFEGMALPGGNHHTTKHNTYHAKRCG